MCPKPLGHSRAGSVVKKADTLIDDHAGMNEQLEELREIKRVAWLTKSAKVLEDWQTKRMVYFTSRYGTDWCGKYLDRVLSASVDL